MAEVEDATKIRRKYIRALENDDFDVLPGKVYVKGFLRSYAKYLGLDGKTLVNRYEEQFPAQVETDRLSETPEMTDFERQPKSNRGWMALMAVLLVGTFFYWWAAAGITPDKDISGGDRQHNRHAQEFPGVNNGNGNSEPREGPVQEPIQEGINVVLEVTDRDCWMHVVVDEGDAFEGLVQPGITKEFRGEESIWVKLGDAGAVKVLVNGNNQGFWGEQGDVVTKVVKIGGDGVSIVEG